MLTSRNLGTCASLLIFSDFFILFSFRDINCQKALGWAGLGLAEPGRASSYF